jgi:hypothetical protein
MSLAALQERESLSPTLWRKTLRRYRTARPSESTSRHSENAAGNRRGDQADAGVNIGNVCAAVGTNDRLTAIT